MPGLFGLASLARWVCLSALCLCGGCDRKVSATSGTIFDKTRTPLTVWFATAGRVVGGKVRVSAIQVQREMEPGSIQTAWMMLRRYRSVMVRPGRERLRGKVEVDESFLGAPAEPAAGDRLSSSLRCRTTRVGVHVRRECRRRSGATTPVQPDRGRAVPY